MDRPAVDACRQPVEASIPISSRKECRSRSSPMLEDMEEEEVSQLLLLPQKTRPCPDVNFDERGGGQATASDAKKAATASTCSAGRLPARRHNLHAQGLSLSS
eukprot:GHVU01116798.1.p3 GENE.GHVU01116798.1~~GHVU01116798.1.p3  ORF type:complete len:103 (+),score=16.55 GHVU01116798.1:454-762(+)